MRCRRLALLALLLAGCGGAEDRGDGFDPFEEVGERTDTSSERSSPRWETIRTASGTGPARESFSVARDAIQWRARFRCESGQMALSAEGRAVGATDCPGAGIAGGVRTGALSLGVEASGRWRVALEQQVDTALREPPLAAMRSPDARVLATGAFYGIERRGRGKATLHRLPGGRLALRFDGFSTSANSDLFVWLSTASRPRTTVQAARADHVVLRELKSTLGEQNYLIPAGVEPAEIRSVVIWCDPVRIAYTAAPLRRVRSATNSP